MKKVVYFNSIREFQAYMKEKTCKYLNEGSEGKVFLGKDGQAYKDFTVGYMADEYLVENVITTGDIDFEIESFVFPDTLFAIKDIDDDGEKNVVIGYTSKCIPKDHLNYLYLFNNGLDHINFDKLIAAYGDMYNDALKLANNGIRIFDLPYNVMFDGEKLYGIDTCGYTKSEEDLVGQNLSSVDTALKSLFHTYVATMYDKSIDTNMGVIPFLTEVERKYTTKSISKTKSKSNDLFKK